MPASQCIDLCSGRPQAPRVARVAAARWLSSGTDLKARFAELLPAEQARPRPPNGHP